MSIDVTGGLVTTAGCLLLVPASGAAGAALASAVGYGAGAAVSVLSWRFPFSRVGRSR